VAKLVGPGCGAAATVVDVRSKSAAGAERRKVMNAIAFVVRAPAII